MWVSATASARADPPNSACRMVGRSRLADIDMHCCQLTLPRQSSPLPGPRGRRRVTRRARARRHRAGP
jgi:hypothetical protein